MKDLALHLAFYQAQLFKTCFQFSGDPGMKLFSVRGKTTGAYLATGSFQWTKATHALCVLFLKYKLGLIDQDDSCSCIQGYKDSLASSLQYALYKKPMWLREMFGTTKSGILRSDFLFLTSNPSRTNGPVAVAINPLYLKPIQIAISHNGEEVVSTQELENLLFHILRRYEPGSDGKLYQRGSGSTLAKAA